MKKTPIKELDDVILACNPPEHLLHRQEQGKLDRADLLGCFIDLASFVIRRSVCGESTRG